MNRIAKPTPINTQQEMMRAITMLNQRRIHTNRRVFQGGLALIAVNIAVWWLLSPVPEVVPRVTAAQETTDVFESKIVPTGSESSIDAGRLEVEKGRSLGNSKTEMRIDGRNVAIPDKLVSSIVSLAEAKPNLLEQGAEYVESTQQIAADILGEPSPRPDTKIETGKSDKYVPGIGVDINEQYQYFDQLINDGVDVDLEARYQESVAINGTGDDQTPSNAQEANNTKARNKPIKSLRELDAALTAVHGDQRYVETTYGEVMLLEEVVRSEADAQVPHTKDRGKYIGQPIDKRTKRIREAARNKIPLTPAERIYFSRLADDDERAANASPDVDQRTVNLAYVDGEIPTITVAKNNIGTLTFTDKRGNPYQIARISPEKVGELFTTHKVENEGNVSNVAEIQGRKLNGSSNISVMLEGRTLPLLFKVNLTQTVNDAKTVVKMNGVAPGFEHISLPEPKTGTAACSADKPVIAAVLDGVIPLDMERLDTPINNVQAFSANGNHYIRSYNEVVTPDCSCLEYGVDNLNVCRMPSNVSVLLMMDRETDKLTTVKLDSSEG